MHKHLRSGCTTQSDSHMQALETEAIDFALTRSSTTDADAERQSVSLLPAEDADRPWYVLAGLGAAAGFGAATAATFAILSTEVLPLPTEIHRVVVLPLIVGLSVVVGAAAATLIPRLCIRRSRHRRIFTRGLGRTALALGLIATVLLLLPSSARSDVVAAFKVLVGPPFYEQLPAGYCEAAAESIATDAAAAHAVGTARPWWRAHGSTPGRAAAALVAAMSEEEQHRLVQGFGWAFATPRAGYFVGSILAVPRLGVPSINMQDAAQGFRTIDGRIVGRVTSWPCGLALGATWDLELTAAFGAALGREFRAKGANVVLGPSVNVHRVARNGRNAEYMGGEDATLAAELAGAWVRGVQGERVAAVAKHYMLNQQETNRFTSSSDPDERALREVYLPPFAAAAAAGAAAMMCAYNRVHGAHACGNEHILRTVLKGDVGFRGWVMSDWWAVHSSSAAALGVDQNLPGNDGYFSPGRLPRGDAPTPRVSAMARRVLTGMLGSGAFDTAVCTVGCDCDPYIYGVNATSAAHVTLARRIGASSAILLKNEAPCTPRPCSGGPTPPGGRRTSPPLPLRRADRVALVGLACAKEHSIDADTSDWMERDYYVVGAAPARRPPPAVRNLGGRRAPFSPSPRVRIRPT